MNIKFLSLSLLITAAAGLGFVQTANASDEDGQSVQRGAGRFNYGVNLFKMDPTTGGGRRFKPLPYGAASAPSSGSSVTPGSVPKMTLDPTFLAPPKPVPTIAPIVTATIVPKQTTFTSIPKSNSPFSSIFGNPQQPLVAQNAKPLSPMTQPSAAPAPSHGVNTQGTARLLTPQHSHRIAASHAPASGGLPAIQSYGPQGYTPGATLPQSVGSGSSVNTTVVGVIRHR